MMNSANILSELGRWLESYSDGAWEHENEGIKISCIDNPGWSVIIDLRGTCSEYKNIEKFKLDHGDNDWIYYEVKNQRFIGCGDYEKLEDILRVFLLFSLEA